MPDAPLLPLVDAPAELLRRHGLRVGYFTIHRAVIDAMVPATRVGRRLFLSEQNLKEIADYFYVPKLAP